MADHNWKRYERRVARYFGTQRTPLSGGASRHTRSDTLDPRFYVEVKSAAGLTGTNGWIWRWLRRLCWPRGALVRAGRHLYLLHSSLPAGGGVVSDKMPKPARRLYKAVCRAARKEGKRPLLALCCKGKRGFWLVGEAGVLLDIVNAKKIAEGNGDAKDGNVD